MEAMTTDGNSPVASSASRSIISLTGQSVGYGLGLLGRQLVVYLALPFFTNHMSQPEFGLVSFAMAVMAFVNTLTNAGLHGAIFRFYHDNDDPQARRRVLGSSLVMLTGFAAVPAVGVWLLSNSIAWSFLGSIAYAPVIQLTAVLLVVDTLVNYGYILLRIQVRPLATSVSNLVIVISQMGMALVLVLVYDRGAVGYLTGLLIGEVIGLGLLGLLTHRIASFQISRQTMGTLLRYGLPLLPASLSMWALHLADRTLVGAFAGLDQVAIYEVGYKMGTLVSLAIAPFGTAWPPFAFAAMRRANAQRIYRDVLTYLLFLCLFATLGIVAFRSEILRLLAPAAYRTALSVVGWVALAQVFNASYLVLSIGPKISKRTSDLAIVAVLAAVSYLLLNVILIPRLGIRGAAIATTVGYGLLAFGSYAIGQRSYPFPLDWARLLKTGLAAVGSYMLIVGVERMGLSGWRYYLGKGGAWLSFLILALLLGVVTALQLRELRRLLIEMLRLRLIRSGKARISTTSGNP